MKKVFYTAATAVLSGLSLSPLHADAEKTQPQADAQENKPNIVVIYADDLGYGDVSCYGNKVFSTPNIDALARDGVRFTRAYSSAATCTPARFSLLTGMYPFRRSGVNILQGDAKMLIKYRTDATVASVLKKAGYKTGIVGKWHLGLGEGSASLNWNAPITPNANSLGFDYSFIMPATNDRVPCIYLRNGSVVNGDPADPIQVNYNSKIGTDPTGRERPDLLEVMYTSGHDGTIVNGISRIGYMSGGKKARWVDRNMGLDFTNEACSFIKQNKSNPFFLYFASHDPHAPRLPNQQFIGKTKLGARGDAILQLDYCVGQIVKELKAQGVYNNTLIIFTSDNGPSVTVGYDDHAQELANKYNYSATAGLRGEKYTWFEGGGRMPMIVVGPTVPKNIVSNALVSHVDLIGVAASLTGQAIPASAIDAQDQREAWFGKSRTGRDHVIFSASNSGGNAFVTDRWKLMIHNTNSANNLLFALSTDEMETTNIIGSNAKKTAELTQKFNAIKTK